MFSVTFKILKFSRCHISMLDFVRNKLRDAHFLKYNHYHLLTCCLKVMFSVVSIYQSVHRDYHVTTAHDAISQSQITWDPLDMFKLVHLGPPLPKPQLHPQLLTIQRPTQTCLNLFTWTSPYKDPQTLGRLENGQLAYH